MKNARVLLLAVLCAVSLAQAVPASAQCEPLPEECEDPLIKNCRGTNTVCLIQPLDDSTYNLEVDSEPFKVFFRYFNLGWPWLIGIASGIAILQAIWGGILIMTSIDHDGGKEKIEWAVGGMVLIALTGFILRFLNPLFYG